MKSIKQLLILAGVFAMLCAIAVMAPAPSNLFAQNPADNAITRPFHIAAAGDLGTCNEGDTEYNSAQHFQKNCDATNVWAIVPAVANPVAGQVYAVSGSPALPVLTLIGDTNLTSNTSTGLSAQRVCHVTYNFAVDAGTTPIVPAGNCVIPSNAVITNLGVQATTSVTAAGSATVALGCVGGTACGSSALMAATAKASLSAGTFGQSIPVPQTASTWVKTTASGGITLTVATGPLTAGVLEIYVYYVVSSS